MSSIKIFRTAIMSFCVMLNVHAQMSGSIFRTFSTPPVSTISDNNGCGGVRNETAGFLEYRRALPLRENERCVWIIRSPRASRYMVHVVKMGFSTNNTQLTITGLSLGIHANFSNYLIPSEDGFVGIMESSQVLVVTLHTGAADYPLHGQETGFIMEFSRLATNTSTNINDVSPRSRDYFIDVSLPGQISHPPPPGCYNRGSEYYSDNELSLLVFAPSNNIYQGNSSIIQVMYQRRGLESCLDHLDVYKFNSNSTNEWKWEYVGRICDSISYAEITSDDLLLIVFRSDTSSFSRGFQLGYARGSYESSNWI